MEVQEKLPLTAEQLRDEPFPWSDVEPGVTFESAKREVIGQIKLESEEQQGEFEELIEEGLILAKNLIDLRNKSLGRHPDNYHNFQHIQWTLVNALRLEVGKVTIEPDRKYDLNYLKLLVASVCAHEAYDWITIQMGGAERNVIYRTVKDFFTAFYLDYKDFANIMKLSKFSQTSDTENIRYQEHLRDIAGTIRGADLAQALSLAYQELVPFHIKDSTIDRQERIINLPAASIALAHVFNALRAKAITQFRWNHWEWVGPDKHFYENFFKPQIDPVMRYWEAYYDLVGKDNFYARNLENLQRLVRQTEERRLRYSEKLNN